MKKFLKKIIQKISKEFSKPFNIEYTEISEHIRLRDLFFKELERISAIEAVDFVQKNCENAYPFTHKHHLLKFAIDNRKISGSILEFGVFKGKSINFIAKNVDQDVHGFDSFEGLPEDWAGGNRYVKADFFSLDGNLPKVESNVSLHKGWFSDTLEEFLKTNNEKVSFLHIDCDVYSSTYFVLDALKERIVSGSLIQFDEYFNFFGWRNHEHKAFKQFIYENNLEPEYLGFTDRRLLVRIK